MRSTIATLILGLSLVAGCEVGDAGGGGGGGGGGDDVQGGTDASVSQTPRLAVTVDKPTISTELMTTTQVTVTLTGSGGFGGMVTLAATPLTDADAPLPGWTVGFNTTTVSVPVDGTGTAVATLTLPSENRGLSGKVRIDATSSLGVQSTSSMVTALNQVSFDVTLSANGQCVYPAAATKSVTVGTKVRFVNKATDNITIHVESTTQGGPTYGVTHQPDPGSLPGAAYEKTINASGTTPIKWYCHAPGPTVNNLLIMAVPAQ
jgi:hypothetical protein